MVLDLKVRNGNDATRFWTCPTFAVDTSSERDFRGVVSNTLLTLFPDDARDSTMGHHRGCNNKMPRPALATGKREIEMGGETTQPLATTKDPSTSRNSSDFSSPQKSGRHKLPRRPRLRTCSSGVLWAAGPSSGAHLTQQNFSLPLAVPWLAVFSVTLTSPYMTEFCSRQSARAWTPPVPTCSRARNKADGAIMLRLVCSNGIDWSLYDGSLLLLVF